MFTFKCSTFYTIIQWNCYKHLSHFCPGNYCRKSAVKLIRCRLHTSATKTGSLQAAHFRQRMLIHCGQHNSAANTWFAADNTIQQQTPDSSRTTQFGSKHLIRCAQHNSTANPWFVANNTTSVANPWFAADHTNSAVTIWFTADHTTQFGSEHLIHCGQHQLGSEHLIHYGPHKFSSEHLIRCWQHNSAANPWFTADNTN